MRLVWYILFYSSLFCLSFACRRILAPGEEEHLEFEEDEEEGGAGAGSPDSFPARVPGRYHLFKNIHYLIRGQAVWNLFWYLLVGSKTSPGPVPI